MNDTISRLLQTNPSPELPEAELPPTVGTVETFRALIAGSPFDRPGLAGLLEAICEASRELADLSYREGDDAVWDRLGEIPAFASSFREWADAVLDVTPATALPQADGDPGPELPEETARARAIRQAAEAAEVELPPEEDIEVDVEEEELAVVALEMLEEEEGETARARAIRQAESRGSVGMVATEGDGADVVEPHLVDLPEGTSVPFASDDASDASSSGGASAEPSAVELALGALDRRVMQMAEQLRRVDQVTADSLGDIRDRLRRLEGRPGVPPVTGPPPVGDGGYGAPEEVPVSSETWGHPEAEILEKLETAAEGAEDAETADSGDPEPAGPETTP